MHVSMSDTRLAVKCIEKSKMLREWAREDFRDNQLRLAYGYTIESLADLAHFQKFVGEIDYKTLYRKLLWLQGLPHQNPQ